MDSPFTAPDVERISLDDEFDFDPIPQFQSRRSRSFDAADIDFTYSEDISNSPLATISFVSRNTVKGAPTLPSVPQANTTEGFTPNRFETARHELAPSPVAKRPEERQDRNLVFVDYDISDEEDDILVGEEDSLLQGEPVEDSLRNTSNRVLDSSYNSAPNMPTEPLIPPTGEQESNILARKDNGGVKGVSVDPPLQFNARSSTPLDTSHDTAPDMQTEPLIPPGELTHKSRSASFTALSSTEQFRAEPSEAESLMDLAVPSLSPVSMRRVSSTPVRSPDRQQRGLVQSQNQHKLQSLPPTLRREGSPLLRVSSPYSLQRQVSVPSRTNPYSLQRQTSTPTLVFTDDPQKNTIDGDNNRSTPKSSSNRAGASIFRSGRVGNNLASPGGAVRTPSPTKSSRHQRRGSSERLTLSAPYALRRHTSLPTGSSTLSRDQSTPAILFSDHDNTGRPSRVEFGPNRNLQATSFHNPVRIESESNNMTGSASLRKSSIGANDWPDIKENPTGVTADGLDSVYDVAESNTGKESGNLQRLPLNVDTNGDFEENSSSHDGSKEEKIFFQRQKMRYLLYLSAFSIFGSTIRVLLVRVFGLSCEISDPTVDEFCITATGRTMQRGGALFADLPANMVGCFIMGIMTSLQPDLWPPIPWFRTDHPLQQHDAYHVGIRTGLCGSITSFASWNAQMVVMMDGTNTELGSQVVTALFGYLIGFSAAVVSFLVGTNVSAWITRWRNPEIAREDDEEAARLTSAGRLEHETDYSEEHDSRRLQHATPPTREIALPDLCSVNHRWRNSLIFKGHLLPFLLVAILLSGYAVGGFIMQNPFYRTLFYSSLLTPPGALLRWELSRMNTSFSERRWRRFHWLPVGTFVANVTACVVSIALLAIETRYLFGDAESNLWAISFLTAVRTGFAGSLSTVSTMVKEMFELNAEFPHHAKPYHYACLTVAVSVVLCISVYSPIVRST